MEHECELASRACVDGHADGDEYTQPICHSNLDFDANTDVDGNSYTERNINSDSYHNANLHTDCNGHSFVNTYHHTDNDSEPYCQSFQDRHANSHCDSNRFAYGNTHAYIKCVSIPTDAQTVLAPDLAAPRTSGLT
jgi:hypothetical protein